MVAFEDRDRVHAGILLRGIVAKNEGAISDCNFLLVFLRFFAFPYEIQEE